MGKALERGQGCRPLGLFFWIMGKCRLSSRYPGMTGPWKKGRPRPFVTIFPPKNSDGKIAHLQMLTKLFNKTGKIYRTTSFSATSYY